MSKESYLAELGQALTAFPADFRKDILQDYEEHFKIGLQKGKTEEQICEELGDISEFVEDLKQAAPTFAETHQNRQWTAQENSAQQAGDPSAAEGADTSRNTSWSEETGKESSKKNSSTEQTTSDQAHHEKAKDRKLDIEIDMGAASEAIARAAGQLANAANRVAREAARKVQQTWTHVADNVSQSMNQNQSGSQTYDEYASTMKRHYIAAAGCHRVKADLQIADVSILPSQDGQLHVYYENHSSLQNKLEYAFDCREQGDTLFVTLNRMEMKSVMQILNVSRFAIDVRMELPCTVQELILESRSGDLCVSGVQLQSLVLKNISGDVQMTEAQVTSAHLSTKSGDLHCTGSTVQDLTMNGISGDITFEGNSRRGMLKTVSGDIEADFRNTEELHAELSSTNGDVDVTLHQMAGLKSECTTVCGDLYVNFNGEKQKGHRSLTSYFGDGRAEIKASSVNGDVKITN